MNLGPQPNAHLTSTRKNQQNPSHSLEQQIQRKLFRELSDLNLTGTPTEKGPWGQDVGPKIIDAGNLRDSLHSLIRKSSPFVRKYEVLGAKNSMLSKIHNQKCAQSPKPTKFHSQLIDKSPTHHKIHTTESLNNGIFQRTEKVHAKFVDIDNSTGPGSMARKNTSTKSRPQIANGNHLNSASWHLGPGETSVGLGLDRTMTSRRQGDVQNDTSIKVALNSDMNKSGQRFQYQIAGLKNSTLRAPGARVPLLM